MDEELMNRARQLLRHTDAQQASQILVEEEGYSPDEVFLAIRSAEILYKDEKTHYEQETFDPDLEGLIELESSHVSKILVLSKRYEKITKTAIIDPVTIATVALIVAPILNDYLNGWIHGEEKIERVKDILNELVYLCNLQISDGAGRFAADFTTFRDNAKRTAELIDQVIQAVSTKDQRVTSIVPDFIQSANKTLELSSVISNHLLQLQDWTSSVGWAFSFTPINTTRKDAFDRKIGEITSSLSTLIYSAETAYEKSVSEAKVEIQKDDSVQKLKEKLKSKQAPSSTKPSKALSPDSEDDDLLSSRFSGSTKTKSKPAGDFELTDETGF